MTVNLAGSSTGNLTLTATPGTFACVPSSAYAFCNEPSGGTTATTAFTVKNTSASAVNGVTVSTGATPADFTVLSNSCTATLAANGTCLVNVAFTPTTTGLRQGALTISDLAGDLAVANLSGTGDDFALQIVNGQPTEVTIAQGGTATFMAQVTPDAVFGLNGETITLACPTNMPDFATCAFNPCPLTIKPSTVAPFNIVIVTSTDTVPAPPVENPCSSTTAANVSPGPGGPSLVFRLAPQASPPSLWTLWRIPFSKRSAASLFPAPSLALVAILCAMALNFGAWRASARSSSARFPLLFGAAILVAALIAGCHHSDSTTPSTATPVGTTTLSMTGSAIDSQGNPMNASRGMQFILDIVKD